MQDKNWKLIHRDLAETAVSILWEHWKILGAPIQSNNEHSYYIDPESMLIFSLCIKKLEARLVEISLSWAPQFSSIFSVQRIKNIQPLFGEACLQDISDFANRACKVGLDNRWKSMIRPDHQTETLEEKARNHLEFAQKSLMLRLRMGLGVNAKSDILSFLIGMRGEPKTCNEIQSALGYSSRSIRRSIDELEAAEFLNVVTAPYQKCRVDFARWARFLNLKAPYPKWMNWAPAFSFILDLIEGLDEGIRAKQSNYILCSKILDLLKKAELFLSGIQIFIGEPNLQKSKVIYEIMDQIIGKFKGTLA